jgi:hypothetical protein
MPITPELADYIQKARASGATDAVIRKGLLDSGWTPVDVDSALSPVITSTPIPPNTQNQNLVAPSTTNTATGKGFSPFLTISITVLCALIISVIGLYALIGKEGVSNILFPGTSLSKNQTLPATKQPITTTNKLGAVASTSATSARTANSSSVAPQKREVVTVPKTQGQIADCKSISDPIEQHRCIVNWLLKTGDGAYCDQSNDPDFRTGCYIAVAAANNSYPACKQANSEDRVFCILVVAAENDDTATCNKFNGPDNLGEMCNYYIKNPDENILIDMAYLGRGIDTKNKTDCSKITYSVIRNECYSAIQ